MITQAEIDNLVKKYETVDFIKDDPIQFCHKYNKSKQDCEIAGFIASLLAYGNRKVFIKKLNELFISSQVWSEHEARCRTGLHGLRPALCHRLVPLLGEAAYGAD